LYHKPRDARVAARLLLVLGHAGAAATVIGQ